MDSRAHLRMVLAGVPTGVTIYVTMFITFGIIGGVGPEPDGLIFEAPGQTEKLVAVYTEIEPLPRIITQPGLMIAGLMGFGTLHALVYHSISPAWPVGLRARTLRFAGLLFVLKYGFFEFWTPFSLFGEPVYIVALELVFWAIIALANAIVVVGIMESDRLDAVFS